MPLSVRQKRIVRSLLAEMTKRPSGLKATAFTALSACSHHVELLGWLHLPQAHAAVAHGQRQKAAIRAERDARNAARAALNADDG